jgi:hypothetical protein
VTGALWAASDSSHVKINGWILDSACALTKGLSKPISRECALACAKGGSPLVVMDDKGAIYLPVSDAMPAISQNDRLLPLAGKRVTVTGKLYEKSGAKGIVIESIQPEASR